MPYVTLPMSQRYHQVSLEDILDGALDPSIFTPDRNAPSCTRTVWKENLRQEFINLYNIPGLIRILREFTERYAHLYAIPREELYDHFDIPKNSIDPRTHRYETRPIDAPKAELKLALYDLKRIFEQDCRALYHTNAFAYIPERCAVNSIQRHQANHSKWFLKTDFHNFFGSTTPAFVEHMLRMIFPFSEIYKSEEGERVLTRALDLCFLNGGLPQGTPISPMLTNVMMIPIDHRLANDLRNWNGTHFIYTRYADDMLISSKVNFRFPDVVRYVNGVLDEFEAPFDLKPQKTRYGSANGHNYNLGVILNDKNEITIGYKKKWAFKGQLYDYIQRKQRQEGIALGEVQQLAGVLSYYRSIEPDFWKNTIQRLNAKCSVDLDKLIANDLKAVGV